MNSGAGYLHNTLLPEWTGDHYLREGFIGGLPNHRSPLQTDVMIGVVGGRAMWRYGFLAVVLVAILALVPAAPSTSGPAAPKRGGTLTVGINADAATLNPFVFRFNIERNILHMTNETLLNYDLKTFDLAYTGALEAVQAAPNGLSYTLRLWANMKFHGRGSEMVA
jgi:hypothetical protein